MKNPELNRDEDFLVKASIISNGKEIHDVPCKIYFPERIYEKPYLVFKPTPDIARITMMFHAGKFKAAKYAFNKDKILQVTIEAPEVYLSGGTKHWGDDISESTILGEPQHLHVIRHLDNSAGQPKTQLVFWISPNELLTPPSIFTTSYTGEIKNEWINTLEFTIKDDVKLAFTKHFKSKTEANGDLVQWSYLVACAELDTPAADVDALRNNVLPDIDDFLLIASFALRKRTACLGWTATDKYSHTTYYRGNYTFPDCNEKSDSHNRLVEIQSFEKFIDTCYTNFSSYKNKLAIRSSLCAAVPLNQDTIEASFLSKFAGLETLLLDFRRREGFEFILENDTWPQLKEYLKKCIKASIEPKLESEQRSSIYTKLDELNRVSLRDAFEMFCRRYEVPLSDLWPVFGEKENVGLVDIRNKLIHGDPFPDNLIGVLAAANQHLQFTLERVLVRVLGWDITKTMVHPDYLGMFSTSMKNLSSEQTRLAEYINS